MPQLDPALFISQIFWLLVVFLLMYTFIARYFIPHMRKAVEGREYKIKNDVNESGRLLDQYHGLKKDIQALIEQARAEAYKTVAESVHYAEEKVHSRIAHIEKEISRNNMKEEEKLSRVKSQMFADLETVADSLKTQILQSVLVLNKKNNKLN